MSSFLQTVSLNETASRFGLMEVTDGFIPSKRSVAAEISSWLTIRVFNGHASQMATGGGFLL